METRQVPKIKQILYAFQVSPGHQLDLGQLLKIDPAEYRARISELRNKYGYTIEYDRKTGKYRYYSKEVIQERLAI